MPHITAVIQTFKRPENLDRQLDLINMQSLSVDEIIISHIENERTPEFDFQDYKYIIWDGYTKPIGQMIASLCCDANTDYIVLFDDDMMPGKQWFEVAHECMQKKEGIYGAAGAYYDEGMWRNYRGFWPYREQENKIAMCDWVGGIWFLKREHIHIMFKESPPFDVHSGSDDMWFGWQAYKHDIPMFTTPYGKNKREHGIIDKPMAGADFALHNGYDDHENDRTALIDWMTKQGREWIQYDHSIPYYVE